MPEPVAPQISALDQPGPSASGPMPTPVQPDAPAAAMTPPMAPPDVTDRSINPAVAPPAPAGPVNAGGHSKLLAMVQGLSDGLAGFSAGLASKGKVSGAEVVQNLEGQRAEQQQRQVAATQAQKDAELRNKLTTAQTNDIMGQTHRMNASFQDDMALKHMSVQEAQQRLTSGAIGNDTATAAYQRENFGLLPPSQTASTTGGAAASGAANAAPISAAERPRVDASLNSNISLGNGVLSVSQDPSLAAAIDNAKAVRANPNATRQDVMSAGQGLTNAININKEITASRTAQEASAISALKLTQDQGAQSVYNRTVPKNAAGQPTEDFATWQARETKSAETQVTQGDPTTLGAMAADGLLTIPQIALGRQLDKKGFQQLIAGADAEAKKNGAPEVTVNGRPTGHFFDANAASQQFEYVKAFNAPNSKSQQSIQSGSTFMEHMADLLAVNNQYARTNVTILNTPLNKIEKTFGGETYTKLMAAIAPVKTEYDNALKAGFAPTAEDSATVDALLKPNSTPKQIEDAGKVMAHTILRRLDSTNQGYKTHAGVDYPNMLTPDAKTALDTMGIPTGDLQSGGSFAGTAQNVNAGKTQVPAGASNEVWVGGKLTGHVVGKNYVPLGQ